MKESLPSTSFLTSFSTHTAPCDRSTPTCLRQIVINWNGPTQPHEGFVTLLLYDVVSSDITSTGFLSSFLFFFGIFSYFSSSTAMFFPMLTLRSGTGVVVPSTDFFGIPPATPTIPAGPMSPSIALPTKLQQSG